MLPHTYNSLEAAQNATENYAVMQPSVPGSASETVATAEECCIAFDDGTKRLFVMLQTSDASSVEYRHLDQKGKKAFQQARKKEIQSLLDLGAYRLLSLEESLSLIHISEPTRPY